MPFVPGSSSIANSGDSPVEGKLGEAIPGFSKFPKIIGRGGHAVDVTIDDTAQPPKADEQPPKSDDQLPKSNDQSPTSDDQSPNTTDQLPKTGDEPRDHQQPTEATSSLANKAQGWVRSVHPDGWIYFFKQHDDKSEGMMCHEIHVASQDEIESNATLNSSAPTEAANHGRLSEVKESGHAVALEFRESVQTYVDDSRWYASENKGLLLLQQHTDEEANELQYNYWKFMHGYPAHHSLPPGAVTAARQALTCYVTEGLLRKSGNRAPFTLAESKGLLEHFDLIEKIDNGNEVKQPPATAQLPLRSPMKTMLVAWVLLTVAKHRQARNYGRITLEEANKQESRDKVVTAALVVFPSAMHHYNRIRAAKSSSDLCGNEETWAAYIDVLVKQWSTFNLMATVLLSASVGLLALPGIDPGTHAVVMLSVYFTIGSILTSVYLISRHHGGGERSKNFPSLLRSKLHIIIFAITLSTPLTLLYFGIQLFIMAALVYSASQYSISPGFAMVIVAVGTLVAITMPAEWVFLNSFSKRRGRDMMNFRP